jgi:hypothetical protein
MPLLKNYQELASTAIDGLQDWLSRIDQVVDKTILINSWAEAQLQTIEDRDSSPLAPINNAISWVFGHPEGMLKNQMEVREAFFGMTGKVEEQVTKVLFQAQKQRGILTELKDVLDSIALAALGDHEVLRKDQLSKKSYWKWVLRSHRTEMKDFDAKMEMCAAFYAHTEQALTVVSTTLIKLQQMKGELVVFRDGLQDASLMLEGGKMVSLRLYIDVLKAGVTNLEATRKSTKLLKGKKMREIEAAMHD